MTAMLKRWVQPAWADELDFVGPRVRPSVLSWLVLLLGLVAAAWVAPQVQQMEDARQEAEATLRRLQRAAHQREVAAQVSAQGSAQGPQPSGARAGADAMAAPRLTAASGPRAAQLAQWLGYPWMLAIGRVEAAAQAEQAVMLSFSLDLASLHGKGDAMPDIRLAAAVRDDAAALRWAQAQGPSAQLLSRDKLNTPFTTADGAYAWRAEAVLAGEAP